MAKDDIRLVISLLPQLAQTAVTSLLMERTKKDDTCPQSWHRYSYMGISPPPAIVV